MSETSSKCAFCGVPFGDIHVDSNPYVRDKWVEGLPEKQRMLACVLNHFEHELSDGFGFYGDVKGFQMLLRELARVGAGP